MNQNTRWSVAGGQWTTRAGQSAAARRLLADMIGHEVAVEHNDGGAPFLPAYPDLHISISHCRTAVAVAVCDKRAVGIDIESRRKVDSGLMQRVCTSDELDAIRRSDDPTMAFLRLWTRKEAVLKCLGTGIRGFESMVHALAACTVEVRDLPCDLPDTVAALAVRVSTPSPSRLHSL